MIIFLTQYQHILYMILPWDVASTTKTEILFLTVELTDGVIQGRAGCRLEVCTLILWIQFCKQTSGFNVIEMTKIIRPKTLQFRCTKVLPS